MKSERQYFGTYRVRRLSKKEQSIKVPSTVAGDFALYLEPDGTMTFEPVGKVQTA